MKVSDSAPFSSVAPSPRWVYAVAVAWLLLHWPFLAPSLEDIDSINFALGLHHFDPALHQPHPPGYPVFIALGRVTLALIHRAAPALWYVRADALALAIWSAIGGAVAIVAGADLFRGMTADREKAPWVGLLAALLMAVTPLFWLTGLRPMSDMFGLGIALAAQALLLRGTTDRRALVMGAIVAGLAAGVRSQTVPLTVPMFAYALFLQRRAGAWLTRPVAAFVAAALLWAVPLVVFTGGVQHYLQALGTQGAEDFAWVDMLWAHPTPKAIAFALYDSLVIPFGTRAAVLMLPTAAIGVVVLLLRDRRALLLATIGFVPYAVFHLLFQETGNLRYATPLVVPIAFLFTSAITALPFPASGQGRRAVAWLAVHAVVLSALTAPTVSATLRYGRAAHPAFRAIADMTAASPGEKPAAVFSHYALRRPLQAAPTKLPVVEPQRNYEWLAAEDYWLKGGTQDVWFLADPMRTDLALIDPKVRHDPRPYRWLSQEDDAFMGTRPMSVDWYRLAPPGWFAGEGWDLTPETAGVARTSGKYLQQQPITAYVRRRTGPLQAIIAGRDLGPASDPPSVFEVAIDGTVVETWRLDPAKDGINFFRVLQLPQGIPAGVGNYATLTIRARAEAAGTPTPQVAVEQFDLQPTDVVMFGFGDGWQEAEYDRTKGLSWRWTSNKAALRILGDGDVLVRLRGESPLKYFDSAPTLTAKAGDRVIATYRPDRDFTWTFTVPADALRDAGRAVTIETDKVYLPGKVEGTADARRLGVRIFDVDVVGTSR